MKNIRKKNRIRTLAFLMMFLVFGITGTLNRGYFQDVFAGDTVKLAEIPAYTGDPYTVINDNIPDFSEEDYSINSFEEYSELDTLGRCGTAYANIGRDLMPVEERGSIGQVKPSGWHTVKYDNVDGKYLYNRCHLIGYQLSAENANDKNLITGTRYMNVEGMLPFENMTADYIRETGNHVLYRVTPVFDGENLLASGVQMEARSVEDDGEGILFNVFCYNVQPGIGLDYLTGDSWQDESSVSEQSDGNRTESVENTELFFTGEDSAEEEMESPVGWTYIVNISTGKFHYPDCGSVQQMKESNKMEYTGSREELISQGYSPCGNCNP